MFSINQKMFDNCQLAGVEYNTEKGSTYVLFKEIANPYSVAEFIQEVIPLTNSEVKYWGQQIWNEELSQEFEFHKPRIFKFKSSIDIINLNMYLEVRYIKERKCWGAIVKVL